MTESEAAEYSSTTLDDPSSKANLDDQPSTHNKHSSHPRPGQHLDDADLLALKRQYVNIGLRKDNTLSNSAEDLSQLIDHIPYHFEGLGQDYNEMDDDELHLSDDTSYDYETCIQERLKKANQEFEHDATPSELKHAQRVSFDAVVKAVDLAPESQNADGANSSTKPPVAPITEEPSVTSTSSANETNTNQYTVPLNDTQPREGPTLLQQLKAMQFHGAPAPLAERRTITNQNRSPDSSPTEDSSQTKMTSNNSSNSEDSSGTTNSLSTSKNLMVVAINDGFVIQTEDDYTAKQMSKRSNREFEDDNNYGSKNDANQTQNLTTISGRRSASDLKKSTELSSSTQVYDLPQKSGNRPKSSDSSKRTNNFDNSTLNSRSFNKNQSTMNKVQRAKSASTAKPLEKPVGESLPKDFYDGLCRQAAENKRKQQEEERLKKEAEEKAKQQQSDKARKRYQKWVEDKDAERRRINEEKRLENQEREERRVKCETELKELREQRYKVWHERKLQEVMIANELKKLQTEENTPSGSSSSLHNATDRTMDHRAFNRWLRRKNEQAKEEKRQLRLEARRLRRLQRRSIKRFQLQQDLQLAKSLGYS